MMMSPSTLPILTIILLAPLISAQTPCAKGNSSRTGFIPCTPCNPGTYQDREGQKSCRSCPRGTYNRRRGAVPRSACKPCPTGTFGSTSAATSPRTLYFVRLVSTRIPSDVLCVVPATGAHTAASREPLHVLRVDHALEERSVRQLPPHHVAHVGSVPPVHIMTPSDGLPAVLAPEGRSTAGEGQSHVLLASYAQLGLSAQPFEPRHVVPARSVHPVPTVTPPDVLPVVPAPGARTAARGERLHALLVSYALEEPLVLSLQPHRLALANGVHLAFIKMIREGVPVALAVRALSARLRERLRVPFVYHVLREPRAAQVLHTVHKFLV